VTSTADTSMDQLRDLIEKLRSRLEQQELQLEKQEVELAELRSSRADRLASTGGLQAIQGNGRMSRAGLLKAAGIGAVAAAAVAGGLESNGGSRGALAATSGPFILGTTNEAENTTILDFDGGVDPDNFSVLLVRDYPGATVGSSHAGVITGLAAYGIHASGGAQGQAVGVDNGVSGITENGDFYGVLGGNTNFGSPSGNSTGAGVRGNGNSKSGFGVAGYNSLGLGVYGAGSFGVQGEITTTTPEAGQAAVYGKNDGTNGNGYGVEGTHAGGGWGGYFTSVSGIGLQGSSTSSTGIKASGTDGLYCRGTSGRGGILKGTAAQLKLVPSRAAGHPASGQAGDFFVDSSKRLWFCKGGAKWKQVQLV
jgi:hypothetical protein